ncbi:MAG TPA: NAD(P)/FAD-dependent oxidoreductase [Gemmatimonadaceae bacterium]|jgi:thioredoxin reductase (NADPH)|nr:NAD(P)/FAD-dependent oxidoreductase [Gemmatimonadaceae bacterium]
MTSPAVAPPQTRTETARASSADPSIKDITIIGGGPTGIFASFYAGMRRATARIVDALPELGGQLTALYPEKYIFDVGGFPKVLAKDLVRSLAEQAGQFNNPVHLAQRVVGLEEADGHFVLVTERERFLSRSILIAAGIGAFSPRRLPQPCAAPWYGRGVYDIVTDPDVFRDQRVLIIGGGDTAFDWGTQLLDRAARVTIIHRSDRFRAHAATVAQYQSAVEAGRAGLFTFHELHDIKCAAGPDRFTHVEIRDVKAKTTRELETNVVLPMLGFVSDLGPLADWGLTLENEEIVVNSLMETGRRGIYAAGDITTYPGKLKLIASGFAEAAAAVNQAVHWIDPSKKIAPGHSSNMNIFGQTDD